MTRCRSSILILLAWASLAVSRPTIALACSPGNPTSVGDIEAAVAPNATEGFIVKAYPTSTYMELDGCLKIKSTAGGPLDKYYGYIGTVTAMFFDVDGGYLTSNGQGVPIAGTVVEFGEAQRFGIGFDTGYRLPDKRVAREVLLEGMLIPCMGSNAATCTGPVQSFLWGLSKFPPASASETVVDLTKIKRNCGNQQGSHAGAQGDPDVEDDLFRLNMQGTTRILDNPVSGTTEVELHACLRFERKEPDDKLVPTRYVAEAHVEFFDRKGSVLGLGTASPGAAGQQLGIITAPLPTIYGDELAVLRHRLINGKSVIVEGIHDFGAGASIPRHDHSDIDPRVLVTVSLWSCDSNGCPGKPVSVLYKILTTCSPFAIPADLKICPN